MTYSVGDYLNIAGHPFIIGYAGGKNVLLVCTTDGESWGCPFSVNDIYSITIEELMDEIEYEFKGITFEQAIILMTE